MSSNCLQDIQVAILCTASNWKDESEAWKRMGLVFPTPTHHGLTLLPTYRRAVHPISQSVSYEHFWVRCMYLSSRLIIKTSESVGQYSREIPGTLEIRLRQFFMSHTMHSKSLLLLQQRSQGLCNSISSQRDPLSRSPPIPQHGHYFNCFETININHIIPLSLFSRVTLKRNLLNYTYQKCFLFLLTETWYSIQDNQTRNKRIGREEVKLSIHR